MTFIKGNIENFGTFDKAYYTIVSGAPKEGG